MNEYAKQVKELRKKQSQLTRKQMKEVEKIYRSAMDEVIKGIPARKNTLSERWRRDYANEIEKFVYNLHDEIEKSIKKNTKHSALLGIEVPKKITEDMLKESGVEMSGTFKTMLSSVQDNVVKDILKGNLYKDGKTLSNRIWKFTKQNGKDVQYIVSEGLAAKKSAVELAADLEKYVLKPSRRPTDWGRCYPALKHKTVDGNAMTLARTSINHAYQTATIQAAMNNPFIDGIQWNSALIPGRTCELCAERHGKIYPVDEVPLDHPNGLCTMIPYSSKDLKEIGKEINSWINGKKNDDLDRFLNNNIISKTTKNVENKLKKGYNKDKINRHEIVKTLQNFKTHSDKWESEIVKNQLDEDQIKLISDGIKYLIDNNEFSIRADSNILENIFNDGRFKNQFETHSSGGALNSEYRKRATKQLFGKGSIKDFKDYEKYGYLGHKNFIEDMHETSTGQYGNCIIRLDKSEFKNNVTYTIGDSLGLAINKMTIAGDAYNPSANGIRKDRLEKTYNLLVSRKGKMELTDFSDEMGIRYIELQYHGELKTDYIKEICFTQDLPNDETINTLKNKNIKLFKVTGEWGDEKVVEI